MKALRRRSSNVHLSYSDPEDSDENEITELDYGEPSFHGVDSDTGTVEPVQMRLPRTRNKTPADRLHLAVWLNDPYKVQVLVYEQSELLNLRQPFFSSSLERGSNYRMPQPTYLVSLIISLHEKELFETRKIGPRWDCDLILCGVCLKLQQ